MFARLKVQQENETGSSGFFEDFPKLLYCSGPRIRLSSGTRIAETAAIEDE